MRSPDFLATVCVAAGGGGSRAETMPDDPRGAKALGPEALARAIRHRRWRAVHARRSRPAVSDRREPGSAEKQREPKRVHPLIVPATRRVTGASGALLSDSLLMHPDSPPEWVDDGLANPTRDPAQLAFPSPRGSRP